VERAEEEVLKQALWCRPKGRRDLGRPAACHLLIRWFAEPISSTLKMETICSSERSVETQRTTLRHIPEDYTLKEELSFHKKCDDARQSLSIFSVIKLFAEIPTSF
jgi:hypothetical protein